MSCDETLVVKGGVCLFPGKGLADADILCMGGRIAEFGRHGSHSGGRVIDARGCLVLPGIVDIHGDAFEPQPVFASA